MKFYQIELSDEIVIYLKELYALVTEKEVRNLLQLWIDGSIRRDKFNRELGGRLVER